MIKRGYGTKILGGGPIFPIPYNHEHKIIDIDNSFKEYKEKKSKMLKKTWIETINEQKAFLFDKSINES
jgi:hypothetical protein